MHNGNENITVEDLWQDGVSFLKSETTKLSQNLKLSKILWINCLFSYKCFRKGHIQKFETLNFILGGFKKERWMNLFQDILNRSRFENEANALKLLRLKIQKES